MLPLFTYCPKVALLHDYAVHIGVEKEQALDRANLFPTNVSVKIKMTEFQSIPTK